MKMNKSYILTIAVTLLVGMSVGAFFFGGTSTIESKGLETHDHTGENSSWTCSMHPQVRQSEPGDCPFCGMALIPVEENRSSNPNALVVTEESMALANIQTTRVGLNPKASSIRLNGKLKYDGRSVHSQTTHFGGRIEKLFKNFEGEQVKKGEVIAHIYSPELVAAQEELLEAKKVAKNNPLLLASARKKLRSWKLTDQQIDRIIQKDEVLREFPLLAQYDGLISQKFVNNGDHLMEGDPLLEISNNKQLWAVFEVYEKDIAQLNLNDLIEFQTQSTTSNYTGRISFISPRVEPSSRVIEVRADVGNTDGSLKVDMFIDGEIKKKAESKEVLTIPRSAVLWTGKRSIVYVKQPDAFIFELRTIELGSTIGEDYEVVSGLEPGEEVVTNGTFTLDAEAQLQGKMSMMQTVNATPVKGVSFTEVTLVAPLAMGKQTPSAFQEQLMTFTLAYIKLKDAMVNGLTNPIAKEAQQVTTKLNAIDGSLLEGNALTHWSSLQKTMQSSLINIESAKTSENQRLEFINLSKALINAIKSFGTESEQPIYIQHCPMANNDQGADWISLTENIINPYFGDLMLTCGYTEETITND